MTADPTTPSQPPPGTALAGPPSVPAFVRELDRLVSLARRGHDQNSAYFNPPNEWLVERMPILDTLSQEEKEQVLAEAEQLDRQVAEANAAGRAATRAWPGVVLRLDNGGLAFFSQLGVARRPDLTQYFIDGFSRNRDSLAFSEASQELFAQVFAHVTQKMQEHFQAGDFIVQSDRQIGDAPGRSFHARQLLFGTHYLQIPYMWRQLTFDMPEDRRQEEPHILEVSIPNWMEDLDMDEDLKQRVRDAGLTQLVFKAPTRGLSLHLGFDYVGEHKMGPLSIAMFLVKQADGLAVQAALSLARVQTLDGRMTNSALITIGPSLHGKSTLTIMIELANSDLGKLLDRSPDPAEGIYPMNDDIVLLQRLPEAIEATRGGSTVRISHSIDGTENNFYAVPFGLTREDDPITYDVVRGSGESPNPQETLENVLVRPENGTPNYLQNPVRNMRMILSRPRLLARKGAGKLLGDITKGRLSEAVHVPMQDMDRVLWQAVMRQNTIVPPLRRMTLEHYIRSLMYGEAVQMGAATGAIGRPYVEYFSDPFIIGLEDENANMMYRILQELAQGGLAQEYYAFNTGGVGAETNDEASGPLYKKIPRDLTLMLQEALLREAVRFEEDPVLGSQFAVSIVNGRGEEVMDLRQEWLPQHIYGEEEYTRRVLELSRSRFYGRDPQDKAGILRYTKVVNSIIDPADIPNPSNERELAWLLSFYWSVDQACNSVPEVADHRAEGQRPSPDILAALTRKYQTATAQGLELPQGSSARLGDLSLG